MAKQRDLLLYLWTLKCFGILCTSYDSGRIWLHTTLLDRALATIILCFTQFFAYSMLTYCILYTNLFFMNEYNRVGNIYLSSEFCLICLLLSAVSLYFYSYHEAHVLVVQKLLQLHQEHLRNGNSKRSFSLYFLYVVLAVLSVCNYMKGFNHSSLPFLVRLVYVLLFSLNYLICGVVVTFYTCLKGVLKDAFRLYNANLQLIVSEYNHNYRQEITTRLRHILEQRSQLLVMCANQLNYTYGISLLPIMAYITFSAPSGVYFFISVVLESQMDMGQRFHAGITSVMWNLPWITILIILTASNNVEHEANKTTKILSKIPRTGTGMDKMIDKFLMKNLRQKYILTAYGFFPLDKTTLFKLFTAISTYMIILLQFKEKEQTTN